MKITAMHGTKPPITKISEFMSSDPFADAFLDEMDKIAKRRLSRLGAAALGVGAGLLGPVVGPRMAATTWRAAIGAGKGVMAGPRGVEAKKMPTLPGQADADAANAARLAAKAKATIAKMHPTDPPASAQR